MRTLRTHRLLGAALFAIAFIVSAFGLMSAISSQRDAASHSARSDRLIVLVTGVEQLVLGLETGQRGFIITGQERFLQPWKQAQRELPARLRELVAAASSSPQQAGRARAIALRVRAYSEDYLSRTVQIARRDPARARAIVASGEGKRRTDDVRTRVNALLAVQHSQVVAQAAQADADSHRAIVIAFVGMAALLLCVILLEVYMGRTVSRPLARMATAANRIADGELHTTVPETGATELSRLAASFNHMATSLRDGVASLKDRNAELDESRQAAVQANLAKSEFLSRMSHELRTPLNGILGFGQLLEMDELASPHDRYVEQVLKGGRHLLALVDELLDIERIESGRVSLSVEVVDAAAVVADLLALIRPLAAERDIEIVMPDRQKPQWVQADQQRLKQVLLNLLSNAIKYNSEGGTLRIAFEPAESERSRILVTDSGIGIAPEDIGRLFIPFERLGAEHTPIEGTGLGLALTKRLVELMDGTIEVQSELGVGTTFTVELARADGPRAESTAVVERAKAQIAETDLSDARVLYIEDNASNLELVEQILAGRPGIELASAMTGRTGIALATSAVPDLILLDLHLPDIPGTEVLTRLQGDPRTRDVPVVVMSADATLRQIERLRLAGASDYLTKPLDIQRFLEVLAEQLPVRPTAVT